MNSESTSQLLEWLVILSFLAAAVGLTFAEAAWVKRKGWSSFGNGFVYSLLSNFVGISIGSVVIFIAMTGLFMVIWDGSINKIPSANLVIGALLFFVAIIAVLILAFCKWLVLKLLKIQSGKPTFAFSMLSSILTFLTVIIIPVVIGYILFK